MTKKLKELTLLDRFLFAQTVENTEALEAMLQIIQGDPEKRLLSKAETEKELRTAPWLRSVRLDVYALDEDKTIYNTEMQAAYKNDLVRRSRYYQSLIDSSVLEPGTVNFNELNDTVIILITPFDLFGQGRYRYTFRGRCDEDMGLELQNGATYIFLNTRGTNDSEVSKELVDFLHYVEKTDDRTAQESESERIRKIHAYVTKIRASEEMGVKYMQSWEEKYWDRYEGKVEATAEAVLELLEDLGEIPQALHDEIMAEEDLPSLKKWHKVAARAESIEDFYGKYKA